MKTFLRRFVIVINFLIAALSVTTRAGGQYVTTQNGQWQPFKPAYSYVLVQFHQVTPQVCTWDLKNNNSGKTLQNLKFSVTYPAAAQNGVYNPYNTKTDIDFLPQPLAPGAVVGGWTAFTAPGSCTNVSFDVVDVTWQ